MNPMNLPPVSSFSFIYCSTEQHSIYNVCIYFHKTRFEDQEQTTTTSLLPICVANISKAFFLCNLLFSTDGIENSWKTNTIRSFNMPFHCRLYAVLALSIASVKWNWHANANFPSGSWAQCELLRFRSFKSFPHEGAPRTRNASSRIRSTQLSGISSVSTVKMWIIYAKSWSILTERKNRIEKTVNGTFSFFSPSFIYFIFFCIISNHFPFVLSSSFHSFTDHREWLSQYCTRYSTFFNPLWRWNVEMRENKKEFCV